MRTTYLLIFYFAFITGLNSQSNLIVLDSLTDKIFSRADKLYYEFQSMAYFYRSSNQLGIEADTIKSYGNGYIQKVEDDLLGFKI